MAAASSRKGPGTLKRRKAKMNPITLRLSSFAVSTSSHHSRKSMSSSSIPKSKSSVRLTATSSSEYSMISRPGEMIGDPRFSFVHSDPKFQSAPQHKSKVLIDSRFRSMLSDTRFSSSSSSALVDKRGRLRAGTDETPLSRYYKLMEPHEEGQLDDHGEDGISDIDEGVGEGKYEGRRETESLSPHLTCDHEPFLRGDANGDADESDTGTDTSSDVEYGVDIEEDYPLQVESIPIIEKETHRLAIVNMDWNHVTATDIYVILGSCIPKGGRIMSVSVYPSEFGINCMAEEAEHGPVGLSNNNTDDDDNYEVQNEIFRDYEKKRLRYYYAVVECDSAGTADYIYKYYDGVEIERSSNVLDLRFIPDSVEFNEAPRDVSTEIPEGYKSLDFYTEALQKSKINISWDEDEPQRVKALRRNFTADELADMELKEFLASDDSDTAEEEDDTLQENNPGRKKGTCDKYRALLNFSKSGSDEEDDLNERQDMEVTFNTGIENLSKRLLERKTKGSETLWETYLRKRSEKRRASRKRSNRSSDDDYDESDGRDSDPEDPDRHDDFFMKEPSVKKRHQRVEKSENGGGATTGASKEELELLLDNDGSREEHGAAVKGYNMKPKKLKDKKMKKKKVKEKKNEDDMSDGDDKIPQVDYSDPRFSELFTSPLFALDPTNPQFKWSADYARRMSQKKKGEGEMGEDMEPEKTAHISSKPNNEQELSFLIKSLKSKSIQKISQHVQ